MIVEGIINGVLGVLSTIFAGLPETPAAPDLAGMLSELIPQSRAAWAFVDEWFPLETMAACVGILLTWMVFIHGFRLTAWVLALIHIGGTDA